MRKHHNLIVWQKSKLLASNDYDITKKFPRDEIFSLTQQMKRAAISIPANVSEGIGRNTFKDTIQFLYISRGSLFELETLIQISLDLNFTNKDATEKILIDIEELSKILNGLIRSYKLKIENK